VRRIQQLLVIAWWGAAATVGVIAPAPDHAAQQVAAQALPVFRLYYPFTGQHLQTVDPHEVTVLTTLVILDGVRFVWQTERPTFRAYAASGGSCPAGSAPVYRLYDSLDGDHLLTADPNERMTLAAPGVSGWAAEGVAFCADRVPSASTAPVYRILRSDGREHLLTADRQEVARLLASGWGRSEGVAFYAPAM
jgi:hypothetical protein